MPNKSWTMMPKGSQMMPKWMPKSRIPDSYPEMGKTLQTICVPIWSVVLGRKNLLKVKQRPMQNRCWKTTRNTYGHLWTHWANKGADIYGKYWMSYLPLIGCHFFHGLDVCFCPCGPRGRGTIAQTRFVSVPVYILIEISLEPYGCLRLLSYVFLFRK